MKKIATILLLSICFVLNSQAQKVALVLSGGGAKGLAHIGVIRALEENNIPIDYITGTSMGAIVAGLYASGYSPDEMETLFRSEQFKFWSTGFIQEKYRYYFTKKEDSPKWIGINIDKKDGELKITLPTNLIPTEQMDFAFMELFSSTNAVCGRDFNQLFVPFLCIATDIYNNKEMELRKGDLGEAIRASMTFPLYFKPIEIDSSLVFDGGILNNFPVKNTMEAFNPDLIIGHKVANNPKKPDEEDIMAQIENMVMKKTDYTIPDNKGILLESTLSDINLLDFGKLDDIEQIGYEEAYKLIDSIKMKVHRRVSYFEIQKRREDFNKRKPELLFKDIIVEGVDDPDQHDFIVQSIKRQRDVITLEEFRNQYFRLIANPHIQSMRPVTFYNELTGYYDIHLKLKRGKPLEAQIGGFISSKSLNYGYASLDFRFFNKQSYQLSANAYFGQFYSSFKLGGKVSFPSEVPVYISGYYTFNRKDYYSASDDFIFEDIIPPYIIQNENNFILEAGLPIGNKGKMLINGSYSSARDEYFMKEVIRKIDRADESKFNGLAGKFRFEQNSFNRIQFPTEGINSFVEIAYVIGKEIYIPGSTSYNLSEKENNQQFYILRAHYDKYIKLNRHFSFGILLDGAYSNRNILSTYRATSLSAPAFQPVQYSLSQFMPEFRAYKYVAGGLKLIWRITDQLHARTETYAFSPIKKIIQTDNFQAAYSNDYFPEMRYMGAAGLVYHTTFGPINLTLNYFDHSGTQFHLLVGFGYLLFNKRGY